jgi:ribosomal protein S12 methylthiotransferase accessory factor
MKDILDLLSLLQPYHGLFSRSQILRGASDEPNIVTRVVYPNRLNPNAHSNLVAPGLLSGAGTAVTEEDTLVPAVGEALERYCATVFSEDQFIWKTAQELGDLAVDLDTFPICSERELISDACPLRRPEKNKKIRWVRGVCLDDGSIKYLPLLSIFITSPAVEAERFLHPVSTGCATHTSYETALLAAICEVLERDSLSIAWLQQLQLPRIEFENPYACLGEVWNKYQSASTAISIHLFDATTNIGIPVIYGLRVSSIDRNLRTVVACSCSLDPMRACRKVMLELASCTEWLRNVGPIPDKVDDFDQLFHGAAYMGREEQASSFNFLLKSPYQRSITHVASQSPCSSIDNPHTALAQTVKRLKSYGYSAYAADLSTDEALRAGLRVVRVVIPGLMPFSWVQRARFLGHPRLYEAPLAMGYPIKCESEINSDPQPFG